MASIVALSLYVNFKKCSLEAAAAIASQSSIQSFTEFDAFGIVNGINGCLEGDNFISMTDILSTVQGRQQFQTAGFTCLSKCIDFDHNSHYDVVLQRALNEFGSFLLGLSMNDFAILFWETSSYKLCDSVFRSVHKNSDISQKVLTKLWRTKEPLVRQSALPYFQQSATPSSTVNSDYSPPKKRSLDPDLATRCKSLSLETSNLSRDKQLVSDNELVAFMVEREQKEAMDIEVGVEHEKKSKVGAQALVGIAEAKEEIVMIKEESVMAKEENVIAKEEKEAKEEAKEETKEEVKEVKGNAKAKESMERVSKGKGKKARKVSKGEGKKSSNSSKKILGNKRDSFESELAVSTIVKKKPKH